VAGNAELVGEEDVERKMEGLGDLKGDDDAAARDAEDDCVGAIGELGQVGGELASGRLCGLRRSWRHKGIIAPGRPVS